MSLVARRSVALLLCTMFVSLAEMYQGEYGVTYSVYALRASPGHDRAMQLADYYAAQMGRTAELGPQYAAYLQASPNGFMAADARAAPAVAAGSGTAVQGPIQAPVSGAGSVSPVQAPVQAPVVSPSGGITPNVPTQAPVQGSGGQQQAPPQF